jgi:hypothetical protein
MIGNDLPIRILAVVGAAALGALLLGWLVQLVVKLAFLRDVPRWPLWALRVLGGVVCGLFAYVWLFGAGGGGFGGPGGLGFWGGPGSGGKDRNGAPVAKKDDRTDKNKDKEKDKDPSDKDDKKGPIGSPTDTMRIEVLGNDSLRKVVKDRPDLTKRFRIAGVDGLVGVEGVKDLVLKRRMQKPPLKRLQIVIWSDSPSRQQAQVRELTSWAEDLEADDGMLKVEFSEPAGPAPID